MMHLIHETCTWGRGRFDGWIIPKAVYSQYQPESPNIFQTKIRQHRRNYVLLETTGYTQGGKMVQRLEVALMAIIRTSSGISQPGDSNLLVNGSGGGPVTPCTGICSTAAPGGSLRPGRSMPQNPQALSFSQNELKLFLTQSGDTNPIHQGDPALVPGLWIFSQLYEKYPQKHLPVQYKIRLVRPTYTGQTIDLDHEADKVTGICRGITHFNMETKKL